MSHQTTAFTALRAASSYLLDSSSPGTYRAKLISHLTSTADDNATNLTYTSRDYLSAISEFLALSILLRRALKLSTFGGRYLNTSVVYKEKGWGYKIGRKLGVTPRRQNESDGLAREAKDSLRQRNKGLRFELKDAIGLAEAAKRRLEKGKYIRVREDTNWASLKAEVSYEMERLRMIAFTESEALFIIRLESILARYTVLRDAFVFVNEELT